MRAAGYSGRARSYCSASSPNDPARRRSRPFTQSGCPPRALQAELGDAHLSHLDLANLAGDGHRELVDDAHVPRDLLVGDTAAAEGPHGRGVEGGRTGAQADPGHQLLAVAVVGHADDRHVLDVGVAVEELLDLAGVDVLAAPDDQVLDAPDDVDVPVLAA